MKPEDRFQEQMETLVSMGFTDRSTNLQGYRRCLTKLSICRVSMLETIAMLIIIM